ncbi:hypothetical protein [Burkholderia sp. Bp8963]|uniref:hypothetical protein n=1 Tax=Burkholderia sp. Bp8963 TaxID=2184547 RepID=UPI0016394E5E|nr:hypothetical protein [Burkholderia sp. Bp8963]
MQLRLPCRCEQEATQCFGFRTIRCDHVTGARRLSCIVTHWRAATAAPPQHTHASRADPECAFQHVAQMERGPIAVVRQDMDQMRASGPGSRHVRKVAVEGICVE